MDILDKLHKYHFEYFVKFFDYKTWLQGCYKELVGISNCHYFHFTQEGIRAYIDDLESPLADAPFKMISQRPTEESPPYFNCPPISAERLKKFQAAKKPEDTVEFWKNLLQGGLGTTQEKLINPIFIDHVSYKKSIEQQKQQQKRPRQQQEQQQLQQQLQQDVGVVIDDDDEEEEVEEIEVDAEETVVKFGKLIEDSENDRYLLQTQFAGSKKFVENERSCFIDVGTDPRDTVINEAFRKWEGSHKLLKRKFMMKPSEFEANKKPRGQNRLPKASIGSILSDGRSRRS